ncbi:MAG: hypothetical protein AAB874_03925, partial [Patescibacteria group bacterium]
MRKKHRSQTSLLITLSLLLLLPLILVGFGTARQLFIRATGIPANITIDAKLTLEQIRPVWNSFAQGGEESADMIAPVASSVSRLSPEFIRIDHIFDHFDVVSRSNNGTLSFNFNRLDGIVRSILKTGARPFFSLSYMPQVIAENGDITGKPKNWSEWELVVQKTVEHYSGRDNLNLTDLYYEVWNEPDLFGNWKYSGDKNYLTLYTYAARGAKNSRNVNPFKFGGPATTSLYKNWLMALANHAFANKLPLDFFSWHRYTTNPAQYAKDVANTTSWFIDKPDFVTIPRLITEWGFNSNIHAGYDSNFAAAHTIASIRQMMYGYGNIFAFELVDGRDPGGKSQWGRWGLITNPAVGVRLKPRFKVFEMLGKIQGTRLLVRGEGTWVTGIAARNDNTYLVLLTNYDEYAKHTESVPVSISGLPAGLYSYSLTRLSENPVTQTINLTGTFNTSIIMPANSVVL